MGKICVLGPRNSGKTTYLAGLAYWPAKQSKSSKSSLFSVQAIGEAKHLEAKAEDIIRQGLSLPQTSIAGGIDEAPLYVFQIKVKRCFRKPCVIDLVARDYPGEIFDELQSGASNPVHEDFLNECLMKDVEGCLVLLADWEKETDRVCSRALEKFIELMDRRDRSNNLRLAVAMSKCERGELWSGRLDPEMDIFGAHLRRTRTILRDRIPARNLSFHAISTFGVLKRNDPRPNRTDLAGKGGCAVLRKPSKWQPYGMISPLYWLSTGKRMNSDA